MSDASAPSTTTHDPAGRLASLWRRGTRPDPRAFLAAAGPLAPGQAAAVLRVDQCLRWEAGERVPAEEYLAMHLALDAGDEEAFELVYGEFLLREERGESPEEDLARRFPRLAGRLRQQVALHRAMGPQDTVEAPAWRPTPEPADGPGRNPVAQAPAPGAAPPAEPVRPVAVCEYAVLSELGSGGMGAVLKAHDADIGRDVAVKVMLADPRAQPQAARRFLEEARITGRLQHPGIVPVYALGRLPDGRPYFAMKLIKGRTLAELLAERADPTADRPRLLHVFEQVCQALAYAHSRGVIHRDLKPANVMVGAYGEVQVMDWGLAKVLTEDGKAAEEAAKEPKEVVSVIRTPRGEDSDTGDDGSETRAGSVLGTPPYMAPEQARGDVEDVDRRSDVFGLGALLCEVLTGKPPYAGPGGEAALKQARRADLANAFARLDGCGADAELVALAKRCLSADPAARPCDAGEMASAVTAYRESVADRLRQAELARAAEAARATEARATAAAERRARRWALGLAASVLALAAAAAAVGYGFQRHWSEQADQAARLRRSVEAALDKAHDLERRDRWPEARAVLEPMRGQLEAGGTEDLRRRVEQALTDAALAERLEGICLKHSTIIDGKFDDRGAQEAYAAAFRDAGLAGDGEDAQTVAARVAASTVRESLTAALDDWAVADGRRRAWLLEAARRADPDPWRDRFRDPAVWTDRGRLEALAKELLADDERLARQTPQLLHALALALDGNKGDAAPLLAAAQARRPDDFWLNLKLGNLYVRAKKWDEAISFYRAAVAARSTAAAANSNLGQALFNRGRFDEAIQECRRALELDPKLAGTHMGFGLVLLDKGQFDESMRESRRALEINPNLASAHNNLGAALLATGQVDEAISELRRALELDPKLTVAHGNLGAALLAKGQVSEAMQELQEYRRAAGEGPQSIERRK